eukprot:gene17121-35436_t
MRGVIRLNDPTSHGGMVVSAAPKTKVMGIAVASKGDYCTCPIPGHGVCMIVEGDPKSPLMATAPAAAPSSSPPRTISLPIAKARQFTPSGAPVESDLLDFLVQTKDLITTNRPLRLRLDCSTQLSDDMLLPQRVYGTESICGSLEYRILCVSARAQLPLKEFIGLPAALDFVTDVLMIMMTAAILFSINPWLALVTLVPLPFIGWMIHTVRDRLRTGFEKIDRVWSEVTNVLADTIPGIRVVKAFAQEKREAQRFRDANQHNLEVNDKLNKTWSLFTPTVSLLTEIGLLVVWAFGIWLVSRNQITVGVLTAFIAYIGRFYGRLDSMSRIVSVTQKAAAGAKRIFDILDHVSNVPDPAQPVKVDKVQGAISMQGVGF